MAEIFFNMMNATKKWIFLKVSSVILIPLMVWFIINLALIYDKEYLDVVSFFVYTTIQVFNITFNDCCFFLFIIKHK